MERCDALIVGGGPAGSTCARALRREGMDVLLIDKAVFPRDKVCAGWVTPAVFAALELDPAIYARHALLQPYTGFSTGLMHGRRTETRYPGIVSYGIRRVEFDDFLLRRAEVRLLLGEGVRHIARRGGGWLINARIRTPLLIGAGGHFCPVARHLGAQTGRGALAVLAQEIEFPLDAAAAARCLIAPETPELYFCDDLRGYGWCLRKGDYLNVGFGREGGAALAGELAAFRACLAQQGRLPGTLPGPLSGHAYTVYGHARRRWVDDGVLLIGDAAGLAAAGSGEGIRPAVHSALIAAGVIAGAGGDYRRERLQAYAGELLAHFGQPPPAPRHGVADAARRALGRMLLGSRWFTRHVLLNRGFLQGGPQAATPGGPA